mmetsp:Transcript_121386/g.259173  ORF Transcript_121386/g.259173 Transcript_121386/m.259173 type:complete len:234 (-) Transcript_121386:102-803(-)
MAPASWVMFAAMVAPSLCADRMSMRLLKDGHFVLEPTDDQVPSHKPEAEMNVKLQVALPEIKAQSFAEDDAFDGYKQLSLAEIEQVMALHLREDPNAPPPALTEEEQKGLSPSAQKEVNASRSVMSDITGGIFKAGASMSGVRGGSLNVAASLTAATVGSAVGLGPDSCVMKTLFIMYVHQGDDDYPYLPRGCGDSFYTFLGAATGWSLSRWAQLAVLLSGLWVAPLQGHDRL